MGRVKKRKEKKKINENKSGRIVERNPFFRGSKHCVALRGELSMHESMNFG